MQFEYADLTRISVPSDAATALVDTMIFKGDITCRAFLNLLNDARLTDMLPDLKTMPWYKPAVTPLTKHIIKGQPTTIGFPSKAYKMVAIGKVLFFFT